MSGSPSGEEGLSLMSHPFLSQPVHVSVLVVAPLPSSVERKLLLPAPLQLFRLHLGSSQCPPVPHAFPPVAAFLSPVLLGQAPHPGPLTCTRPSCGGCSVSHAPPLPSSPAGPTPSRSCAGGLGGRGIMNSWGGGGPGELFPCFLLLLTNLPFLCLDFDLSEGTVGFY